MSYRQLDAKGKPIPKKGRTGREPATKKERGKTLYHYEIYVAISQPGGKAKQIRKRFWLPDDIAAQEKQREIKREPSRDALTWEEAHKKWLDFHRGEFSEGHVNTSIVCGSGMRRSARIPPSKGRRWRSIPDGSTKRPWRALPGPRR